MAEVERVEEERGGEKLQLWHHPGWTTRFPWLIQGITGSRDGESEADFGLFGDAPVGAVLGRWERLRNETGMSRVVHARQVHGAKLLVSSGGEVDELVVASGYDGHITGASGVLLTVSVADCVPVYLVDAEAALVGLVHAGWRGVAAGILERSFERMAEEGGVVSRMWLHCGPSICGRCYEVGPEVHVAVNPKQAPPARPTPIDLPAAIVARAQRVGVGLEKVTRSTHCTRCGSGNFFSHRAGSPARQVAFLGLRR